MLFVAVDGGEGAGMIMGVSVEKEVASGPWLEEITSLVVALGFICAYHSAKTGDICHSVTTLHCSSFAWATISFRIKRLIG